MKYIKIILLVIIWVIPEFIMAQNKEDYKDNLYFFMLEKFINNLSSNHYFKEREDKIIYGEINDYNLNENLEFNEVIYGPMNTVELKKEMMYYKKEKVLLRKIWPLNLNENGNLQSSIVLYEVCFNRIIKGSLEYSFLYSKKYIFDTSECELRMIE